MDCPGCESKIKKALQKLDGVDDVDIDMSMQKVTVTGWVDRKKVLKKVRKTGRRAEFWPFPHNPEYYNCTPYYYNQQYQHQGHTFSYHTSHPPTTYNYKKHGYTYDHDYYHQPLDSVIVDDGARSVFSDDNAHACSIM